MDSENLPTLAVAHLRNVTMGPEILEYLERIDATLKPYAVATSCTAVRSTAWRGAGAAI